MTDTNPSTRRTPRKNPGGAKLLLNDPNVKKTFLTAIRLGSTLTDACTAAGIHDSTYRHWRTQAADGKEPYATFFAEVQKARSELKLQLLSTIRLRGAENKDDKTAIETAKWMLSKLWPEEFGTREHVTHAGDPEKPLIPAAEASRRYLQDMFSVAAAGKPAKKPEERTP